MVIKLVALFLVVMMVLAMFGRLRVPGKDLFSKRNAAKKCPKCGRFKIGKGPCACQKGNV